MSDHLQEVKDYCHSILSGERPACKLVILAVKRFEFMLKESAGGKSEYVFSKKHATQIFLWLERKGVVFVKDRWANKPITFEAWQKFIIVNIYGWRHRDDQSRRFMRDIIIFIPRKAGKSLLASVLAIYEFGCSGEGSEVYFVGRDRNQSGICFSNAQALIEKSAELKKQFIVRREKVCLKQYDYDMNMWREDRTSIMKPLSKDSKSMDGLNPHASIFDEVAQYDDPKLTEVITSGMMSRKNPIRISITTASTNQTNKFYDDYLYMKKLLTGEASNFRWFGILYTLDDDDDPFCKESLIKANPMVGITVDAENLFQKLQEAKEKPSDRAEFFMKQYNLFQKSSNAWMNLDFWTRNNEEYFDRSQIEVTFCGFDLASTRDINAVCFLHRLKDDTYFAEFQNFLPEKALDYISDLVITTFKKAVETRSLQLTKGEVIDHEAISDFIIGSYPPDKIHTIGFDPHNASQVVKTLDDEGYTLQKISQSAFNLSEAVKETEKLLGQNKLKHFADPFIDYQFECVELVKLPKDNVRLDKSSISNNKIDAIIALVICVKVALENPTASGSVGFYY